MQASELNPLLEKPIFDQITELVADIPGWTPIDELYTLYLLAMSNANQPGNIVEIGSWCGRSTLVLALAAKNIGNKKVYAIDLFPNKDEWVENEDGSFSFRVKIKNQLFDGCKDQTVWREPFKKQILPVYKRWKSIQDALEENLSKNGLEKYVSVIKNTSDYMHNISGLKINLAFIDGGHCFKSVVKDINNVEEFLEPNGWIAFDDAFTCYEGVNKAIEEKIINSSKYKSYQQYTRKLFCAQKL